MLIFAAMVVLTMAFQINQSPNGYNINDSRRYAVYTSIVFCPKDKVEAWSCKTGEGYPKLTNVTYVENTFTKAASYIGYNPEQK